MAALIVGAGGATVEPARRRLTPVPAEK